MEKLNYLNVDMVSRSPDVIEYNLLKGIPFPDNQFDVVYHSQVLEHFPKEKAEGFLKECFRVLKKDGIIRIVVPDLENIVDEYKKFLQQNIENPNEESDANYDWIMLEMFDQTVRNSSGGLMAQFFYKDEMVNEKYVIDRIGFVGSELRNSYLSSKKQSQTIGEATIARKSFNPVSFSLRAARFIKRKIKNLFADKAYEKEEYKIGKFRLGGEVHMWMYDRYSLSRLLKNVGFTNIEIKSPTDSDIDDWGTYELDVKNGIAFDPTSLFIEARK